MDFLSFFASGGLGAIVGAVGGLANRWLDLKAKAMEIADRANQRAHELALRDKDLEALKVETTGKMEVATLEAAAKSEQAGFDALRASYAHDSSFGNTKTDILRKLVRPVITLFFMGIVAYVNYHILLVLKVAQTLGKEEVMEILRWTLFEASVVIGWWFAQRPSEGNAIRLPAPKGR